jgi:hypothetical protein
VSDEVHVNVLFLCVVTINNTNGNKTWRVLFLD